MRIGMTLLFGMVALVVLGYLARYTFDAQRIIQSQREEIAQLKTQLHQTSQSLQDGVRKEQELKADIAVLNNQLSTHQADISTLNQQLSICTTSLEKPENNRSQGAELNNAAGTNSEWSSLHKIIGFNLLGEDIQNASLLGLASFAVLAILGFYILILRLWRIKRIVDKNLQGMTPSGLVQVLVTKDEARQISMNRRKRE